MSARRSRKMNCKNSRLLRLLPDQIFIDRITGLTGFYVIHSSPWCQVRNLTRFRAKQLADAGVSGQAGLAFQA